MRYFLFSHSYQVFESQRVGHSKGTSPFELATFAGLGSYACPVAPRLDRLGPNPRELLSAKSARTYLVAWISGVEGGK